MEFPVRTGAPASQKTACSLLPIFDDGRLRGATRQVDSASRGLVAQLVRAGDVSGRLGTTLLVHRTTGTAAERWMLVGCGKHEEFSGKRYCAALAAAVQTLKGTGLKEATSYLGYEPPAGLDAYYLARLTVETVRSGIYRFDELKSQSDPAPKLARVGVAVADKGQTRALRRGITHGQGIAAGMDLARDLANRPPNICTPSHLAKAARDLARKHESLETQVLGESEIRKLGMGAFLSVTQGTPEPARLIIIRHRGAGTRSAPVAICGKGITFDTGGISLKPPPKMDEMKFDMCGAAGVIGTMAALGELRLPINVVAVVPACENMPSATATHPGDIVTSMSGQTVEILNTDAEGRLILCDALTYAQRFKPRFLLDVATLTGACIIALGNLYSGLFSNDEELVDALLAAGKRSQDFAWRLPVEEGYGESLKSNFADIANSGTRDGGASIAAHFLSRFTSGTRWAHLDIAGVAWRSNANKGATGRPVPLLMDFLLNLD